MLIKESTEQPTACAYFSKAKLIAESNQLVGDEEVGLIFPPRNPYMKRKIHTGEGPSPKANLLSRAKRTDIVSETHIALSDLYSFTF